MVIRKYRVHQPFTAIVIAMYKVVYSVGHIAIVVFGTVDTRDSHHKTRIQHGLGGFAIVTWVVATVRLPIGITGLGI